MVNTRVLIAAAIFVFSASLALPRPALAVFDGQNEACEWLFLAAQSKMWSPGSVSQILGGEFFRAATAPLPNHGDRAMFDFVDEDLPRTWLGMWSFRIRHTSALRDAYASSRFWDLQLNRLVMQNPADAYELLSFAQVRMHERLNSLGAHRFIDFGVIVESGTKKLPEIRSLGADELASTAISTGASAGPVQSYFLWAKLLLHYSAQPMMATHFIGHEFGHLLAAEAHPIADRVRVVEYMEKYLDARAARPRNREELSAFDGVWYFNALWLFENLTLPNLEVARKFREEMAPAAATAMRSLYASKSSSMFLQATDWIGGALFHEAIEADLKRFEQTILADRSKFYASIEAYGGEYYDLGASLQGKIPGDLRVIRGTSSLDDLYVQYTSNDGAGKRVALVRLYLAFQNAAEGKVDFESVFRGILNRNLNRSDGKTPAEASTEEYLKSYAIGSNKAVISGYLGTGAL